MTVKELYNWCKAYRYKDAQVFLCKNYEEGDEQGNLTDLYELDSVSDQNVVVDMGMEFEDVHQVILEFKNGRN